MTTQRLFLGLSLPEELRTQLAALAEPIAGVRWVPKANLHLTLRFLGEIGSERRVQIERALEQVQVPAFDLSVCDLGAFSARGPLRILWAGLLMPPPEIFQLRQQIDDGMLSLGLTPEKQDFHPHVTLARVEGGADPRHISALLQRHRNFSAPLFRAQAFHLYASELRHGSPPAYRILRSFALIA